MARSFARVQSSIWSDPAWTKLPGEAQRLYLLLLSQPRLSLCGHLDLTPARWASMSADTDTDAILASLGVLAETRFIIMDGDELTIRSFSLHDIGNGVVNKNLLAGFWSAWEAVHSPVLRREIVMNMPDELWSHPANKPPETARSARSEPRFDARSEPSSEPPSPLSPLPYVATSTITTTEVVEPPAPATVDEQAIRKTAVAIGRAEAWTDPAGVGNPEAFASTVTRRLLTDPARQAERDRIRHELAAGRTPEQIAAGWRTTTGPVISADEQEQIRQKARQAEQATRARLEVNAAAPHDPDAGLAAVRAIRESRKQATA
jgi:hypothetical protein